MGSVVCSDVHRAGWRLLHCRRTFFSSNVNLREMLSSYKTPRRKYSDTSSLCFIQLLASQDTTPDSGKAWKDYGRSLGYKNNFLFVKCTLTFYILNFFWCRLSLLLKSTPCVFISCAPKWAQKKLYNLNIVTTATQEQQWLVDKLY